MPRKSKNRKRRAVVDTSVLVAGIAGFREPYQEGRNPSADLLYGWAEGDSFLWLYSEDVMSEYKVILRRLQIRPHRIGAVINLIRERAEKVEIRSNRAISPDPDDDPICLCAVDGEADFIVTLNLKDFPQDRLTARVVRPEQFINPKADPFRTV